MGGIRRLYFLLALPLVLALPALAEDPAPLASGADQQAQNQLLLDVVDTGKRLVAVGRFGHILLSDDKGETWRLAQSTPSRTTLTAVHFPEPDLGFAVGFDSVILRTQDGGENWQQVYQDPELENAATRTRAYTQDINSCVVEPEPDGCLVPLLAVYFRDRLHGLAMGTFGMTLETSDGGKSWTRRELFPGNDLDYHVNALFRTQDGTYYAPAELGAVYRSQDDGRSFELIETGYEGSFWGGLDLGGGSVLVYGMRGNVWRSDNGGDYWEKLDSGSDRSFHDGMRLANGDIVLAGLSGEVAVSRDGTSFTAAARPDRLSIAALAEGQEKLLLFGVSGILSQPIPEPR